jgi:hypothetical protein
MSGVEPKFGWMMGAVGADGESDAALYRQMIADAELGAELGYDAAWVVEHHFSDYYPTPSPLLLLAHIAARCPGDGGTGDAMAPATTYGGGDCHAERTDRRPASYWPRPW